MSGYMSQEDGTRIFVDDAEFIQKPIDDTRLLAIVTCLLRKPGP
jgi:hypothetical protein